ncbi:MAG: hypothetical protein Q7T82_08590 [Armatimonadota bacterium]|nr:hypothetical protein [Armatimonadota bacterium]
MPIPFQDQNTVSTGTAGYLKFLTPAAKGVWLGALFIMNDRGEPVEFTHARVSSPKPLLWRPNDLRMRCIESLCASMFDVCPVVPDLLLCLSEEGDLRSLAESISLRVPVGRITHDGSGGDVSTRWSMDFAPHSPPARIHKRLCERGLLVEPFERAEAGLREVYSELLR